MGSALLNRHRLCIPAARAMGTGLGRVTDDLAAFVDWVGNYRCSLVCYAAGYGRWHRGVESAEPPRRTATESRDTHGLWNRSLLFSRSPLDP